MILYELYIVRISYNACFGPRLETAYSSNDNIDVEECERIEDRLEQLGERAYARPEFLVAVRMGCQGFRVTVTDESD
jgi:hypothetical protein